VQQAIHPILITAFVHSGVHRTVHFLRFIQASVLPNYRVPFNLHESDSHYFCSFSEARSSKVAPFSGVNSHASQLYGLSECGRWDGVDGSGVFTSVCYCSGVEFLYG